MKNEREMLTMIEENMEGAIALIQNMKKNIHGYNDNCPSMLTERIENIAKVLNNYYFRY